MTFRQPAGQPVAFGCHLADRIVKCDIAPVDLGNSTTSAANGSGVWTSARGSTSREGRVSGGR